MYRRARVGIQHDDVRCVYLLLVRRDIRVGVVDREGCELDGVRGDLGEAGDRLLVFRGHHDPGIRSL